MKSLPFALFTAVAAGLIFGCGGGGGGGSTNGDGSNGTNATNVTTNIDPSAYQYVNLAPDATTRLRLDGTLKAETLGFGGRYPSTGIETLTPGSHNFTVVGRTGETEAEVEVDPAVDVDQIFQIFSMGRVAVGEEFRLVYFSNSRSNLGTDRAYARILNATNRTGKVDVYVTNPDQSIDDLSPNVLNLAKYGYSNGLITFNPGSFRVRVTPTGAKTPLLVDQTITVEARRIGTVALVENGENLDLQSYFSRF